MKIDKLVEQGYEIFSKYTITSSLDICKLCCMNDEEERKLVKTPLRELDEDILAIYINSASCGSAKECAEMCYFMPRVLELLSQDVFPTICTDTLFDRLFNANSIITKESEEYLFLQEFLSEYWIRYINKSENVEFFQDIVVMIGRHFAIEPFLKQWKCSKSEASTLYFIELIFYFDRFDTLGMFASPELDRIVYSWYVSELTKDTFMKKLEDLYFQAATDDNLRLYLDTAYMLYNIALNS